MTTSPSSRSGRAGFENLPLAEVTWLAKTAARIGEVKTLESLTEACEGVLKHFSDFVFNGMYLLDVDSGKLRMFNAAGLTEQERQRAEAAAQDSHPGFVLRTGQSLRLRDSFVGHGELEEGEGPRRTVTRSRLMLPVARDGDVFGAFGLSSTEPDAFDEYDRALLSFVCELAAIAYQRIRAEHIARAERERSVIAERNSAHNRFASLLRAVPDAIVGMGSDGMITYWNAGAAVLLGWSEDDVIGQDITLIMPERHQSAHNAGLARHLRTGESRVVGKAVELPALHRDGHEIPVELMISRVDDGENIYFVGVLRDISLRIAQGVARDHAEQEIGRFNAALLEIGRAPHDDIKTFLRLTTEAVSRALEIERVSVWRWHGGALECGDLFERTPGTHSHGLQILQRDQPEYFAAIRAEDNVVASDAHTHPATRGFSSSYLAPLGIRSMLDVPLRSFDGLRGVLCVESTSPRIWRDTEVRFATEVAGFVVQALERVMRQRLEQRNAAVLASIDEAVVAFDENLHVTLMNPVAEQMCGWTRLDGVGRSVAEVVSLLTVDTRLPVLDVAEVLRAGTARTYAKRLLLVRPDGGETLVALTVSPMLDDDIGRGVVLSLRDVTAEEAARRELDERNRRLRSLGEAIPDLLFSVSADGRVTMLKDAPHTSEGSDLIVPADEIPQHTVRTLFDPQLAARIEDAMGQALSTGHLQTLEYDLVMPHGPQMFEARLARMSDTEATVIVRNITAERERAAALVAQRERLQALLSSSAAIIHSSRLPAFETEYISESFTAVLGYAKSDAFIDGFWQSSLHPDDSERVRAGLSTLFSTGHVVHEYRRRHADGSYRWLRDEVRVIHDEFGAPIRAVGAIIDITSLRRDEARLATILAVQQVVSQMSSAFLAGRGVRSGDIVSRSLSELGSVTTAARVFVARGHGKAVEEIIEWSVDAGYGHGPEALKRANNDVADCIDRLAGGVSTMTSSRVLGGGRTLIMIPMLVDGELRGVLGVDGARAEALTDEELLGLMALVADALAAGLQRLDDERDLRELTDRLRRQGGQQRALLEMSGELARTTTRSEVYSIIQARLPTLSGIDHLSLIKPTDDGRLRVRAFAGTGVPAIVGSSFTSDITLASAEGTSFEALLHSGEPVTTQHHAVDAFVDWREWASVGLTQIVSVPLVPVVGASDMAGMLTLGTRAVGRWGTEDFAWAVQFGLLVGGHLSTLRAGDELRQLNEALEARVEERTAELRASEERFELLFQSAPQAMIIVDAAGRVVQSNRGAQSLFGYDETAFDALALAVLVPATVRGRHDGLLRGFLDRPDLHAQAMAPGRTIFGRRSDDSEFPAEIGLVPLMVRGERQVLAGITDITARVAAQEEISQSLREKEVLLKEIHHRVKNNLQIISSLLMMQSEQMPSDDARRMMHESVYRVRSMALIHQLFYGSESLEKIDLGAYAKGLSSSLAGVLAPAARITVLAENITVPVDIAVPLGLILNELLTNAFKYGLPTTADALLQAHTAGRSDVTVEVSVEGSMLRVAVMDSGPGLPDNVDVATAGTLGLQLVRSLTRQLRGQLTLMRQPQAGITLTFALPTGTA